jgi:hypothetical protein
MKAKNRTKRTRRVTRLAALSIVVVFLAFATGSRTVTEAQDDVANVGPGTGIDFTFTNPEPVVIPVGETELLTRPSSTSQTCRPSWRK